MIVQEILDDESFFALEPDWRALEATAGLTPFQSWDWMSTWWRHARRGTLWVLVARAAGRVVGILPLCVARAYRLPLRRVSFLATPISDYHAVLAAPADADACARRFLEFIAEEAHRWDLVDLPDLPSASPLARAAREGSSPVRVEVAPHRICPVIRLAPTWDAQRAGLGKKLRARVGQMKNRLTRAFDVSFDVVGEGELLPALDELFWLHDRRWRARGLAGAFADERIRSFHRDVAPKLHARGHLRLHRLRLDGKTRALFYCFAGGETVYYYLSGFELALSRYSLGTVLMSQAVSASIAEGAREFDLLRGDENYKREWCAEERATVRLVMARRTLRSRVALSANRLERRLERVGARLRNRLFGHRPSARARRSTPPARI